MKIQIKHRTTDAVLWEDEAANLSDANLRGQYLCTPCAQSEGVVTPSTEVPTRLEPIDGVSSHIPVAHGKQGVALQCESCSGVLD